MADSDRRVDGRGPNDRPSAPCEAPDDDARAADTGSGDTGAAGGGQISCLVIEDDRDLAAVLSAVFEMRGYRVAVAADGRQGLNHLRSGRFDAIFLDLNLPEVSGFELLRAIEREGLDHGGVCVLSGDPHGREKILRAGADEHLVKPATVAQLMAVVDRFIASG